MSDDQQEIEEIRGEIERIRRDFAAWKGAKTPSRRRRPPAGGSGFAARFRTAVADQWPRQRKLLLIEGRVSALEKRVTELEQRRRASTS